MAIISREILRRIALLVALPVGALMIAWPASRLLALSGVDWEVKRRHEIATLLSEEARRDLNVNIREQTEGHVVTLSADQWRTFIGQGRETLAGRPPTPTWNAAAEGREYYHKVRGAYLDPGGRVAGSERFAKARNVRREAWLCLWPTFIRHANGQDWDHYSTSASSSPRLLLRTPRTTSRGYSPSTSRSQCWPFLSSMPSGERCRLRSNNFR